jgi:DNA/RNA endonuclease YhcR with UshA esterase domain
MNEKKLTKISAVGVCISIIALYIVTNQIFSVNVNIGEIDKSFIGKSVNITGTVVGITKNKGNFFVDLEDDTGKIKLILWEDTAELLQSNGIEINELNKGNIINVVGEVQVYRGELEIIPIRGNLNFL